MHQLIANDPDHALEDGLWWLKVSGVEEMSRAGRVIVSPVPVFTRNMRPRQRVIFNPLRDANPFFHLFESLWMLAGQRHVAPLLLFNSRMGEFVDKGQDDLHGAYGYRWRKAFSRDQVAKIVEMLKADPSTRQAVLQVWHETWDLGTKTKDVPCNTQAYFRVVDGKLTMCVTARSNDAVWGAHGANVVHWSMLQEYVACAVGLDMGEFQQFSFNYHVYPDNPGVRELLHTPYAQPNYYTSGLIRPSIWLCDPGNTGKFLDDCLLMVDMVQNWDEGRFPLKEHWYTAFFEKVAAPMLRVWFQRRQGLPYDLPNDCDWHVAANEWIARRDCDGSK